MRRQSTLADVAEAAAVSKTTASMVLNGKWTQKIPESTRTRIEDAAVALKFRPNGVARALVRRRSNVLGVICTINPFVELSHHAFEHSLLSGVFYHALERGYNPMIYAPVLESVTERLFPDHTDGRSDAFVMLYPDAASQLLRCLPDLGIPAVALCGIAPGASWVDSDHEAGMRLAVDALATLGHRRIAYVVDPHADISAHVRIRAFRGAMRGRGLEPREDWIVPYAWEGSDPEPQLRDLLTGLDRPSALLTWNDFIAELVYHEIRAMGLRIPDDISVVGFDDAPSAKSAVPPLTTVRQDILSLGRTAVDFAVAGVEDPDVRCRAQTRLLPVELVMRELTAPPPAQSANRGN